MTKRRWNVGVRDDQAGTATAIITVAVAGVALLAFQGSADVHPGPVRLALAWVAYAVYLGTLVLDGTDVFPALRRPGSQRALIAVMLVSGVTVRLAVPPFDWLAVLFVVTAAGATFVLPMPLVAGIVVVQTLAVAVGSVWAGADAFSVAFVSTIYLMFQLFAVIMVRSLVRVGAARRELAAVNAELAAATTMLEISSRDTERLRIARDLHDVVGHQLTALALELEIAGHHVDGAAAEHVKRARTVTKDLLTDIREVVGELRQGPHRLDAALRTMLGRLPGLSVDLDVDERRPVDESRALAVMRLVQEVATNTLRHAYADRLTVRVASDEGGISVAARDDGIGARVWRMGHGLTGMEERITELGGEVDFDPGPGRGFAVTAWLPAG